MASSISAAPVLVPTETVDMEEREAAASLSKHLARTTRNVTYISMRGLGLEEFDLKMLGSNLGTLCVLDLSHNRLKCFPTFRHHPITSSTQRKYLPRSNASQEEEQSYSICPNLWYLDVSHNRIEKLPHVAASVPVMGTVRLHENPFSPDVVVSSLSGLCAAEITVPSNTSVESLVDVMLGIRCINGSVPVQSMSKKLALNQQHLRRKYKKVQPFSDILDCLANRGSLEMHRRSTKDPRTSERRLLVQMLCAHHLHKSTSIESTNGFSFGFEIVSHDLSPEEEPVCLAYWESLKEDSLASEVMRSTFSAVLHGILDVKRIPGILAASIREFSKNLSERDRIGFDRLSRYVHDWPPFVLEHLISLLKLDVMKKEEIDFLLIRDQVEDDENLADVSKLAQEQARSIQAKTSEEAKIAIENTRHESEFRESMSLKRKLFSQLSASRVPSPALQSSVISNSESSMHASMHSPSSVVQLSSDTISSRIEETNEDEAPEQFHTFLRQNSSGFLKSRKPCLPQTTHRYTLENEAFPSSAAIPLHKLRVGDKVRCFGKNVPKTLKNTTAVVLSPAVDDEGSFKVQVIDLKQQERLKLFLLTINNIQEWHPGDMCWTYKWKDFDDARNPTLPPQTKSSPNASTRAKNKTPPIPVLEFLKQRGMAKDTSQHAEKSINDALRGSDEIFVEEYRGSEIISSKIDESLSRGTQLRDSYQWSKEEEKKVEALISSTGQFCARELLEFASNALGAKRKDGSVCRLIQSAAWVMAPELEVDFCESLETAKKCILSTVQSQLGTPIIERPVSAALLKRPPSCSSRPVASVTHMSNIPTVTSPTVLPSNSEKEHRAHSASLQRRPISASLKKVRAASASIRALRQLNGPKKTRSISSAGSTKSTISTNTSPNSSSVMNTPQHHPFVQEVKELMQRKRDRLDFIEKVKPFDKNEARRVACSATLRPLRGAVEATKSSFLPASVRHHVTGKRRPSSAPEEHLGPIVFTDV